MISSSVCIFNFQVIIKPGHFRRPHTPLGRAEMPGGRNDIGSHIGIGVIFHQKMSKTISANDAHVPGDKDIIP